MFQIWQVYNNVRIKFLFEISNRSVEKNKREIPTLDVKKTLQTESRILQSLHIFFVTLTFGTERVL